ncbi:serine/threonine-protein phosphatase 6 regulatory ankyrin repeat subunit A [Microdochium nivale]|nr:serine/threonine-protein phosphatase 6 regulatory ankyrin repeat subunit A [Microdochium nivale]
MGRSAHAASASFSALPPELIPLIGQFLDTRDALALAATRRHFYVILNDRIYARHIRTEAQGDWPLWWAASQPSGSDHALVTARRAIRLGADPNAFVCQEPDDDGVRVCPDPPLLLALKNSFKAMVRLLVEYGADPYAMGRHMSPLMLAIMCDDLETFQLLLSPSPPSGPDGLVARPTPQAVNRRILESGSSLLHLTTGGCHDAMVVWLLECGARVDIRDNEGCTPLHNAVQSERISTVRILLDAGADLFALDYKGQSGLDMAVAQVALSSTSEMRTLYKGAKKKSERFLGELLCLCQSRASDGSTRLRIPEGHAFRLLAPTNHGVSSAKHILAAVKIALECGALPDARCAGNPAVTPLWHCAKLLTTEAGNDDAAVTAVARVLVDAGADVNFRDQKWGQTALHHAAGLGRPELAALLLARGADLYTEDNKGATAVSYATCAKSESDVMRVLLGHERQEDGSLSQATADLLHAKHQGFTPLVCALWHGRARAAMALLESGVCASLAANGMNSPLALAVWRGSTVALCRKLIENGAGVDDVIVDLCTPLMFAVLSGSDESVQFLVEQGANVDSVLPGPETVEEMAVLSVAARRGRLAAVRVLLKAGASLDLALKYDAQLLEFCRTNHPLVADVLEGREVEGE